MTTGCPRLCGPHAAVRPTADNVHSCAEIAAARWPLEYGDAYWARTRREHVRVTPPDRTPVSAAGGVRARLEAVAAHVGTYDPTRQPGQVLPVAVREVGEQVPDPCGEKLGPAADTCSPTLARSIGTLPARKISSSPI